MQLLKRAQTHSGTQTLQKCCWCCLAAHEYISAHSMAVEASTLSVCKASSSVMHVCRLPSKCNFLVTLFYIAIERLDALFTIAQFSVAQISNCRFIRGYIDVAFFLWRIFQLPNFPIAPSSVAQFFVAVLRKSNRLDHSSEARWDITRFRVGILLRRRPFLNDKEYGFHTDLAPVFIIIIIMEKTEAGLKGLCIREIKTI